MVVIIMNKERKDANCYEVLSDLFNTVAYSLGYYKKVCWEESKIEIHVAVF